MAVDKVGKLVDMEASSRNGARYVDAEKTSGKVTKEREE